MRYTVSADIAAPAERVWAVLSDVERMPAWTSSMTSVERLDPGPLRVGSSVRIKQPKFPAVIWRVTELTPARSFAWVASGPGTTTTAEHALAPAADGRVTATLTIRQSGFLAPVFGLLTSAITRRYVDTELQGLKSRAEAVAV